jgi:hypothetical protein
VSEWTDDQLERIGVPEEVEIATVDAEGTWRPFIIAWVVRVDQGLYVRSFHGTGGSWYRRAQGSGRGRIRADGREYDVSFEPPQPGAQPAISDAYRVKYATSPYMEPMVAPDVVAATLRIVAT